MNTKETTMNIKLSSIICLTGILSFSTGAFAAETPTFKQADADESGFVDDKEFAKTTEAGIEKTLAELDGDKDGKLSKDEYSVILEEDCE